MEWITNDKKVVPMIHLTALEVYFVLLCQKIIDAEDTSGLLHQSRGHEGRLSC